MQNNFFKYLNFLVFYLFPTLLFAEENSHATPHHLNVLKEIVYPYINLFVLFGLLIYLLRKPAKDFFLTRSKNIAQSIEKSAHEKQQAEVLLQQSQNRLKGLDQEIARLNETLKNEGELTKRKIIEEAKISSQRMEEITKWIADQEVRRSREKLKEEMVDLATKAAEKIIEQNLKPTDQEQMIKNSLNRLESFS